MILRLKIRLSHAAGVVPRADFKGLLPSGEPELFTSMIQAPARRWLPVSCSLVLHVCMLGGALYTLDNTRQTVESLTSRYTVHLIRFDSASLIWPVARGSAVKGQRTGPRAALASGPVAEHHAAPPRRFEMSKLSAQNQGAQTLLQPEMPLDLPANSDLRLPELLLWKPHPPQPAPAPRKAFAWQKPAETSPKVWNVPVPPVLQLPNNELRATELAFSGRIVNAAPLLARTPGAAAPVPVLPAGVVQLPSGPDSADRSSVGGSGAGLEITAIDSGRAVTKVVLPPDGQFTVLVESSGSEAFPETEGVLSGKTVYTVYVRVGAGKEWILQYCLPRAAEQALSVSGGRVPLAAPYPYLILRPQLSFGPDVDYLILHGTVTALGKFDQLTYLTAPEEQDEKDVLLRSLQQWQLRPGKVNGQAVALEVLLIIPRDRESAGQVR